VKKNLFLLLVAITFLCAGCASKQVRVYESIPESRSQIVEYAMTLMGKPYKSAAKGPDAFDCSGLVYYVYKRFDIPLPYTTEELDRAGFEIPRQSVLPGDLVFFKIKRAYHMGIMVDGHGFIHASKSRGVAIDKLNTPYWQKSLLRFRRVL
jgi:cell wall-associated NlpC family hydrolase